jgi:hypothetical protein
MSDQILTTDLIIVKDDIDKTAKEWVIYLKDEKNQLGRKYTDGIIRDYARMKRHGFSYKVYPDLPGEMWKEIDGSKNTRGRWEISNMCRVKYITAHAENVLSGERLYLRNGYPTIAINGKHRYCHIVAFMTFYPEEYASKKPYEIVLHVGDNKLDFRPYKLRLGTHSENGIEAHDNGKHDGTKTARMKCASYINGVFEKEHESQYDAETYLKSIGFEKASQSNICNALCGKHNTLYGRVWKKFVCT